MNAELSVSARRDKPNEADDVRAPLAVALDACLAADGVHRVAGLVLDELERVRLVLPQLRVDEKHPPRRPLPDLPLKYVRLSVDFDLVIPHAKRRLL